MVRSDNATYYYVALDYLVVFVNLNLSRFGTPESCRKIRAHVNYVAWHTQSSTWPPYGDFTGTSTTFDNVGSPPLSVSLIVDIDLFP